MQRNRTPAWVWLSAIAAALLFGAVTAPDAWARSKDDPDFQTAAQHAILIEADSGSVLFAKDETTAVPPASLSKLMTAEVVFNEIKQGMLSLDDEFEISEDAWRRGGAPSGGSTMFAAIHSQVSVYNLLHGVIIQSGNDACITLAEGIAGDEDGFARLMNGRAYEIGLQDSSFVNATGLDADGHVMSARDLAMLARYIIKTYPEFYPYYGEREFTWNKIRQFNRNPLLKMDIGADGLKTGYTKAAGYGLVGSAVQKGIRLIVVVMGLPDAKARGDEARKLLEWGFNSFEARHLFGEGQYIAEAKVYGGASGSVPLMAKRPIQIMVPRHLDEQIRARVVYQGPLRVPVKKGQEVATLKVWRGDDLVLTEPLLTAEDVGQGSLFQRALDAVEEVMIGLIHAAIAKI